MKNRPIKNDHNEVLNDENDMSIEGGIHKCKLCEKEFSHLSGLKSHIRSHEGIRNGSGRPRKPENLYKKYICDLCNEEYDLIKDFKKVRFLLNKSGDR